MEAICKRRAARPPPRQDCLQVPNCCVDGASAVLKCSAYSAYTEGLCSRPPLPRNSGNCASS